MTDPKVTVLMSVYNGERYLNEAIDSILAQTFTDFEFLIIDDASTDSTPEILFSYDDQRIRIVTNEENLGLTKSLNKGLALAKGEYIARMDADDISLPHRIKTQVNYLNTNLNIGVCGSWIETLGNMKSEIWRYPLNNDEIRSKHLFECSMAHPAVMIRKQVLDVNNISYDPRYTRAQDYEFWVRLSQLIHVANIGEVLLKHRIHTDAIGQNFSHEQIECADTIRSRQLSSLLHIIPTERELAIHQSLSLHKPVNNFDNLREVNNWLLKIWNANQETSYYDDQSLSHELGMRWKEVCMQAISLGKEVWTLFNSSPLSNAISLTKKEKYLFLIKSHLKFLYLIKNY